VLRVLLVLQVLRVLLVLPGLLELEVHQVRQVLLDPQDLRVPLDLLEHQGQADLQALAVLLEQLELAVLPEQPVLLDPLVRLGLPALLALPEQVVLQDPPELEVLLVLQVLLVQQE
jgi:hypothetical protein